MRLHVRRRERKEERESIPEFMYQSTEGQAISPGEVKVLYLYILIPL